MRHKPIILLIAALIITLIIWLLYTPPPTKFQEVEFQNPNFTLNITKTSYLDTIARVGLDILDIHHSSIHIYPLHPQFKKQYEKLNPNIEIHALLREINGKYQIFIDTTRGGRDSYVNSIAHELIHLKQYKTSKLQQVGDTLYWKGNPVTNSIPYMEREWEIEAYIEGQKLSNKIKDILYP